MRAGKLQPSLCHPDPALAFETVGQQGPFDGRLRLSPGIVVAVHAPDIVAGQRLRKVLAAPVRLRPTAIAVRMLAFGFSARDASPPACGCCRPS